MCFSLPQTRDQYKVFPNLFQAKFQALSVVASSAGELATGKKRQKLNDDLAALVKLHKAGLLEPFILLNAADEGIARDYEGREHRDILVRYLDEVVVPPVPKPQS